MDEANSSEEGATELYISEEEGISAEITAINTSSSVLPPLIDNLYPNSPTLVDILGMKGTKQHISVKVKSTYIFVSKYKWVPTAKLVFQSH